MAIITTIRRLAAASDRTSWGILPSLYSRWRSRTGHACQTCLSIDVDVRNGRVPSVTAMSDSHRLIYQRGFGTVREIWSSWWRKWSGQGVSECLEGCPDSDERSDTWSSWDGAMWTDAWKYSWVDTWNKASTFAIVVPTVFIPTHDEVTIVDYAWRLTHLKDAQVNDFLLYFQILYSWLFYSCWDVILNNFPINNTKWSSCD